MWALGVIFYEVLVGQHPFLPPCLCSSPSPAAGGASAKPSTMMSKREESVLIVNICEMPFPALPETNARLVASLLFRSVSPPR